MHLQFLRWILLLPPLIILPIFGMWLLKTGIWPRRRGETPHCADCGYNLTGLTGERCPECGHQLAAGGVVHGERRRLPGRIVGGTVCLLPIAMIATLIVANVNWYGLAPTFLLISDLQGQNPTRSWNELNQRIKAGTLSVSQRSRLIDIGLKEQVRITPSPFSFYELMNHLGGWAAAGLMSDPQARMFYEQMVSLTIRVRPKVVQGDHVPVEVAHKGSSPSNITVSLEANEVFIDGEKFLVGSGSSSFSGFGASGHSVSYCRYNKIGRHEIEVRPKVSVYLGPTTGVPIHQRTVSLTTTFEIVAPAPQYAIRLKPDPMLGDAIRQAIWPEGFELGRHRKNELTGQYKVDSVPVNIAFEVFARIEGKEHRLGSLCENAGASTTSMTSLGLKETSFNKFDLIFRSSEKVARETLDMHEIWQGELVYTDVPVKLGPNAMTKPATQRSDEQ